MLIKGSKYSDVIEARIIELSSITGIPANEKKAREQNRPDCFYLVKVDENSYYLAAGIKGTDKHFEILGRYNKGLTPKELDIAIWYFLQGIRLESFMHSYQRILR